MGIMAGTMGVGVIVAMVFMLAGVAIWGGLSHCILLISGGAPAGIGRTYQAICYAFGANVSAILLIFCGGQYVGWIWWVISATIMMKEAHRIHGGRAALATLLPPVTAVAAIISLYILLIATIIGAAGTRAAAAAATAGATATSFDTANIAAALESWAADHNGAGPPHALMLVEGGNLEAMSFLTFSGDLESAAPLYPGAPVRFYDYYTSFAPTQRQMARDAAAALPANVVAHRVGDFVFTWHGVDMIVGDRALWVMVLAPIDVDTVSGLPADRCTIVYVDGTTESLPLADLPAALVDQNEVRAVFGLPPVPDPMTVTQERPGVGAPK
jgi:hypothetical protein